MSCEHLSQNPLFVCHFSKLLVFKDCLYQTHRIASDFYAGRFLKFCSSPFLRFAAEH